MRVRNDNFGSTLVQRLKRWREEHTLLVQRGPIGGFLGRLIA
jgi:hypothetical protein